MLNQWLDAAERSLLAGQFNRAVRDAETVLRNEAGAESSELSIRAAYVLLQALFELNRSPPPTHTPPPTPPPPTQAITHPITHLGQICRQRRSGPTVACRHDVRHLRGLTQKLAYALATTLQVLVL